MRRSAVFLACAFVSIASAAVWQKALTPSARVSHPALSEMSGIVKSKHFRNTFWVHNDSGDKARIFAIRQDGSVIAHASADVSKYEGISIPGARNVDWEDIATDGRNLYISDLGNNGNARRNLGIYVIKEPDPTRTSVVRDIFRIPVRYQDQKEFPPAHRRFDSEAIFTLRGKLYAITKHRANAFMPATGANLYRLDTMKPDEVNVLRKVDGSAKLGGWVTAADVSPDGKTLAVLTHAPVQSVWLFSTAAKNDKFLSQSKSKQIVFQKGQQCEGLCWLDAKTLLITNEQREIFRINL
jgi:hypothetical protein